MLKGEEHLVVARILEPRALTWFIFVHFSGGYRMKVFSYNVQDWSFYNVNTLNTIAHLKSLHSMVTNMKKQMLNVNDVLVNLTDEVVRIVINCSVTVGHNMTVQWLSSTYCIHGIPQTSSVERDARQNKKGFLYRTVNLVHYWLMGSSNHWSSIIIN